MELRKKTLEKVDIVFPDGTEECVNTYKTIVEEGSNSEELKEVTLPVIAQEEDFTILPETNLEYVTDGMLRTMKYFKTHRYRGRSTWISGYIANCNGNALAITEAAPKMRSLQHSYVSTYSTTERATTETRSILPIGLMHTAVSSRATKLAEVRIDINELCMDLNIPNCLPAVFYTWLLYIRKGITPTYGYGVDSTYRQVYSWSSSSRNCDIESLLEDFKNEDINNILRWSASIEYFPLTAPIGEPTRIGTGTYESAKYNMTLFGAGINAQKISGEMYTVGFMSLGKYLKHISSAALEPDEHRVLFTMVADAAMMPYILSSIYYGTPISPSAFTLVVASELLDKVITSKFIEAMYAEAYDYAVRNGIQIVECPMDVITDLCYPRVHIPDSKLSRSSQKELINNIIDSESRGSINITNRVNPIDTIYSHLFYYHSA